MGTWRPVEFSDSGTLKSCLPFYVGMPISPGPLEDFANFIPLDTIIFIDHVALAKQGELVASVRLFVCLRMLSRLIRLTLDLDFWHGGLE